jgi:uncharacterized protein (TIGR03435 family)
MHLALAICALSLAAEAVFGQSPSAPPAFESASVKPATPQPHSQVISIVGGVQDGIEYRNVSLRSLILAAYELEEYRVSGPNWLATERFDVVATTSSRIPREAVSLMLRTLLEERFELKVHRAPKEMPVYALVVAKNGPKLQPSNWPDPRQIMRGGHIQLTRCSIAQLIPLLSLAVDRPILDMTGLTGVYDMTLDFAFGQAPGKSRLSAASGGSGDVSAHGTMTDRNAGGPSLFSALQKQLGLKLETRKAPVEILVVDHARTVPIGD